MANPVKATIGCEPYCTQVRVCNDTAHTITADDPVSANGKDTGPAPFDLLLSALVSCKVITVRMYADRKGWPVERIEATARIVSWNGHAADQIEVEMEFVGDLTEEQKNRLLTIAEQCPVQKTLEQSARIATMLTV